MKLTENEFIVIIGLVYSIGLILGMCMAQYIKMSKKYKPPKK
jgi:hypothetical protein